MPKGEFDNLFRLEASRRKERGDVISKNGIGRNEWLKMFNLRKRKKEGAIDCALENPSVFPPTVDERTYHVCFQNIRRTHSQKITKKDDTACRQLATLMYAALTLVKIYKN